VILSEEKITEEDVRNFVIPKDGASISAASLEGVFNKFSKFHEFKEFVEKSFIEYKLNKNVWNVSRTAEELAIQRSHLYNKIEKFNLERV
jgi:DNA-binding NtrC family response regulator